MAGWLPTRSLRLQPLHCSLRLQVRVAAVRGRHAPLRSRRPLTAASLVATADHCGMCADGIWRMGRVEGLQPRELAQLDVQGRNR